jgi:anti-sigma factor RsiW
VEAGEVFVMNCQEFWNTMPELRDAAGERHLTECPACATRMSRQHELAAALRTMAADYRSVAAPARVEARLRTAFRNQAGVAPGWPLQPAWVPALTWAAAFVAMIALAVFLIRDREPVPVQPAPARVEMAMAATSEDAQPDFEGFITLPNAGRLAENEDVNMVRVEVPRSAMIALGLEVSPERAGELVAADVMLGPDGLARAVRFLDSDTLF